MWRATAPSASRRLKRRSSAERLIGPHCRLPDIRRRCRIASAERAIEIGKIAKPHTKSDRADAAVRKARVAEHPICAREPPAEDKCREGEAFVLEELVPYRGVTRWRCATSATDRSPSARLALMSVMIALSRAAAMPCPSATARPPRTATIVAAMRSCRWLTASRCNSGVASGRSSAIAQA